MFYPRTTSHTHGNTWLRRAATVLRIGLLGACLVVPASLAMAANQLALVVGIDTYEHVAPLQKANNDARAVSAALTDLGFETTTVIDADRRTFNREISGFAAKIQPGDEVVFYFAGHGIQVNGRNYLLPADVPPAKPGDEPFVIGESIDVKRVLSIFRGQGARITTLILDACRDNPFQSDGQRSIGGARGLAMMNAPEGSFILFSAGTGQLALDRLDTKDPNPNSVFTRELLPLLTEVNLSTRDLANRVRSRVKDLAASVGHNQFPAYDDQINGDYSLNPAVQTDVSTTSASVASVATAAEADSACITRGCIENVCNGKSANVPFENLNGAGLDMTQQGRHLSFDTVAGICVDGEDVVVDTGALRRISCQEIIDSEDEGMGHAFTHEGQAYYFWLYINPESDPKRLEIGLYQDGQKSQQFYWIETGAELCN